MTKEVTLLPVEYSGVESKMPTHVVSTQKKSFFREPMLRFFENCFAKEMWQKSHKMKQVYLKTKVFKEKKHTFVYFLKISSSPAAKISNISAVSKIREKCENDDPGSKED
jgi:hypothetical protein